MPTKELIELEAADALKNLEVLQTLRPVTDGLLWYGYQLLHIDGNIGTQSAASLGRLMIDSCTHVEQALLSVLRGQPRLGWAALRISAEALKDLDAIDRMPELHPLWMALAKVSSPAEVDAALKAFKAKRQTLPKTTVTNVCQACMDACSVLGSHPNASAWRTMGPVASLPGNVAELPSRLRDADGIRSHIGQMALHCMNVLSMLTGFRLKYLAQAKRDELLRYFSRLVAAHKHAFPEAEPVVYED